MQISPIKLRGLILDPPIALGPMVALTHTALRTLVLRTGGVGLLFTEMLAVRRLPSETPKHSPLLHFSPEERPLFYQLVGAEPERVEAAVARIYGLGAAGIDLNLGCPAPAQRKQGAGAALAANLPLLREMLAVLRRATDLPLSVKIRLSPAEKPGAAVDFCRMLEGEGIDLISVHARRPGEKFCRRPHWEEVAPVKRALKVPILINGGIFSVEDARLAMERSGADGVMLGRGGVEQPWLCRDIALNFSGRGEKKSVDAEKMYYNFIELLRERFASEKCLSRLKIFTRYYSRNFRFGHNLEAKVQSSDNLEEAEERARLFFAETCEEELRR
ncbi:tRNA-dihydrouridine synthase family protein [Desulforhopalus vacuolatus]|uniref:tRNA dihydrouridine synthase n=1 Tax=Desulforhopalus vacuolatus TaxID=40414 RepID=UPI001965CF52|nr:tRNA-dihydrouridine synthase family protein [Desulforhopalus vacuolatus]MBM9520944.1 tRNA-dihydrouridine synthase family protein [Desulforhopalus vacuolatus]